MAFTILGRVGEDNPKSVLATTVVSYSLSSILTGAVFYAMGRFHIGTLIGFFPRHILVGCIGGVGWFLVATGLEVSARLDGNLNYDLATLHQLGRADTVLLWLIPLFLAIMLFVIKYWVKHPLTDATFFISIIAIFYFFVAAIDTLNLPELRGSGWIFAAPKAGVPFYHFYSLYGLYCLLNIELCADADVRFRSSRLESNCRHGASYACLDFLRDSSCAHQCASSGIDNRRRQCRYRS